MDTFDIISWAHFEFMSIRQFDNSTIRQFKMTPNTDFPS